MFRLSVADNAKEILAMIGQRPDQMRYAIARAATKTGVIVKEFEVKEIKDVFDRPTPYTLNSMYLKSATKADPSAVVYLKSDTSKGTPADKYLTPEIRGGTRVAKRFERAFIAVGVMPAGYRAVPAKSKACPIDNYGNVPASFLSQLLSYFKAFPEQGYRANITAKRREALARGTKNRQGFVYFVGKPGGGKEPLGIWRRTMFAKGSAIEPVLLFVDGVHYHGIYDFEYVARSTTQREFPAQMREAITEALRTAR